MKHLDEHIVHLVNNKSNQVKAKQADAYVAVYRQVPPIESGSMWEIWKVG